MKSKIIYLVLFIVLIIWVILVLNIPKTEIKDIKDSWGTTNNETIKEISGWKDKKDNIINLE